MDDEGFNAQISVIAAIAAVAATVTCFHTLPSTSGWKQRAFGQG